MGEAMDASIVTKGLGSALLTALGALLAWTFGEGAVPARLLSLWPPG